jgi:hypothetical protein
LARLCVEFVVIKVTTVNAMIRPKVRRQRRGRQPKNLSIGSLPERSQSARDNALHVLSAMRGDPSLSLTRAAKLEGIKPATVKKYFPSALRVSNGKFRAAKGDRYSATLYIPDSQGNSVPVKTRSSKERKELSNYLRDLGRYLRGDRNALARWQGKKIAGIELVTDGRTIKTIEPELSDFSLYRTLNGGAV